MAGHVDLIRSILIVEDDPLTARAFKTCIERRGETIATVASSLVETRQLLAALGSAFRPDACIVDHRLPGESGLDLLPELRARYPRTVIVFISGYGTFELGAEAHAAGANHVLAKPVTFGEIVARVAGRARDREPDDETASDERARWEHMQRVLRDCSGNRSETARRLRLDRGTLQRWLERPAPR